MRGLALILVCSAGCFFDGAQTEGMPCNNDGECGVGIDCIERVCGGPRIAADTDTETETETDTDAVEEESSAAMDDDAVRDYCVPEDTMCLDSNTLRYCSEDGKLTTYGCPGVCGESVETIGCVFHPGANSDVCLCTFDIVSCTSEGSYVCSGTGQGQCIDGRLRHDDCDDVCIEAGYAGADYCDGGTCYCSYTCSDGAQRCIDGNTWAGCWGGSWQYQSCDQICRDNGYTTSYGCHFYPGDDSGCMCA